MEEEPLLYDSRPKLLDTFCCGGGAGRGYADAGFAVYGIDLFAQPHYPYPFHQGDAVAALEWLAAGGSLDFTHPDGTVEWVSGADFAAVHGSPPCQAFTNAQKIQKNEHPNLIDPTRDVLTRWGLPWVIENVVGAPLVDPVLLCGAMFPGLQVYRHRLFESNVALTVPEHPAHVAKVTKMGRAPVDGEFMHVVGNFSGVQKGREAMGIDWMVRDELREAIPPAMTAHLGTQLLAEVHRRQALPLAA